MSCAGTYCAAKAVGTRRSDSARDRTGESPQTAFRVRKPVSRIASRRFHELRRQILRRESRWCTAIRFGARSDERIAANGIPCPQTGFKNRPAPFFMSCAGTYCAAKAVGARQSDSARDRMGESPNNPPRTAFRRVVNRLQKSHCTSSRRLRRDILRRENCFSALTPARQSDKRRTVRRQYRDRRGIRGDHRRECTDDCPPESAIRPHFQD